MPDGGVTATALPTLASERLEMLETLEKRVLWLSSWMIHNANHLRENIDGLKVGGHQASSASLATVMAALYFDALRPEDRVAVKPHASPALHAILYLMGRQSRQKLTDFRAFGGAQSYPSRTKDTDDIDFSTGSVGLGVAQTLFASMVQDYVRSHGWGLSHPEGKMVALLGDAELDEGNIYEALLEGHKHGLRNCWWVVDYNRQSLDAVSEDGQHDRLSAVFSALGWDVVTLKHGRLQQAAFAEPGGEGLERWIDACPNADYATLCFRGGAAWRNRLSADFADDPDLLALIDRRDDDELATLMTNLGGHDISELCAAFRNARTHDRPVVFFAYTIKGHGLPLAGHKDNHAGLMTPDQIAVLRARLGVPEGREWERGRTAEEEAEIARFLQTVPFLTGLTLRRHRAPPVQVPHNIGLDRAGLLSTQAAFGFLMGELAKSDHPVADRIVTTSPDVTVSTNLGAWVNRRKLHTPAVREDAFRLAQLPSTFRWDGSPDGQHIELGIAEMNLFSLLSALGLSGDLFGETLIPVGTLYDPFISRGLDGLNYACYQDARFILAATPSGITLAPEGGAHQSIATPLIGMSQPGLAMFEPAFGHELAVILRFALQYVQSRGTPAPDDLLKDAEGGAIYLRLSTRAIDQTPEPSAEDQANILKGAYWLRPPSPEADVVIAYAGAVSPEAIAAAGYLAEARRTAVLAVTSADRLHKGWTEAGARRAEGDAISSHIEQLFAPLGRDCVLVTVSDGHPASLAWLGSVYGHRSRALGVSAFGQSGAIHDLYRAHGIDTDAILGAVRSLSAGRPIRW